METQTVQIDERLAPLLRELTDPEIPVLSIMDMGVVRRATLQGNKAFVQMPFRWNPTQTRRP